MTTHKPDFFIVGAPKCGTTAMNDYLAAHPDIFMAQKELHFFGSDLQFAPAFRRRDLNSYLAAFSEKQNQIRIGEASVWYLFSKQAAQEIKAFMPDARIIIMLRNPVDMLYSNYFQFLYNGNEDLPTFREALDAEEDRKQGLRIPKTVHLPQGLYYRETVKYAEQVQRYFDTFGRNQVQVIIFDDFKSDTARVYRQVLEFLEVDPTFQTELGVRNPNKRIRSAWLRNFLNTPPDWYRTLQPFARRLISPRLRTRMYRGIRNLNTEFMPRQPLDPTLRRELQLYLRPEVEKLSTLLGRDLTDWVAISSNS